MTRTRLSAGLRVSHGWASVRTGCSLGRYSSEIRTGCANQRPSGSVRGQPAMAVPTAIDNSLCRRIFWWKRYWVAKRWPAQSMVIIANPNGSPGPRPPKIRTYFSFPRLLKGSRPCVESSHFRFTSETLNRRSHPNQIAAQTSLTAIPAVTSTTPRTARLYCEGPHGHLKELVGLGLAKPMR